MEQREIKAKLTKLNNMLTAAKVSHGIAKKEYDNFMSEMEGNYALNSVAQAKNKIKELSTKILQGRDKLNALLAEAQSILENTTMEVNDGNTAQTTTDRRQAPARNKTMAPNRVRTPQRRALQMGRTPQSR